MSDLLNNIYAECFSPIRVKMYDAIDRKEVFRDVPCGKCYHCRITKVNEWVTRMVLQSMYSKYVYFGTLTYAVTDSDVFRETSPMLSRFNCDNKLQPTPILLRKDHLQKFFKRLRKQTGTKFQYFACGEYGNKYGRPHFHYIMWSDVAISEESVSNSWSTTDDNGNRVLIGRIEHQDLRKDARNIEHSYKYVCKYVQKSNFDYNKLVTKELHEKYIKEELLCGFNVTKNLYFETKGEHIKKYSPFTCCSKRPAIGNRFFEDHVGEFSKGNFKLFGVKGKYVFPLYYYRKTREYLCPYKTISSKNDKPNSYSTIPQVVTLLVELQNAIIFNEGFLSNSPIVRFGGVNSQLNTVEFPTRHAGRDTSGMIRLPCQYFNFYDCKNKLYYYLRGDGDYDVCAKRYHWLYKIPAKALINDLRETYSNLLNSFLKQMHDVSEIRRNDKYQRIMLEYDGNYDAYLSNKSKVIENLLSIIDDKQLKYNLTKQEF
ncbi:MAG: hypothetical protein IKY87_01125 [Paludibacteraceae bacterium]|nr:hypothetical protein [Paludibacteraceae bacterium]